METNIAINNDAPALSGDIALIEDRTSGQPYLFVTATDGANNLLVNRYTIAAGTDAVAGQNVATIPGAFGGADLQLSQQANKLLVEYYTETPNPVTFTAKGEIMVYELDADYLPVAGVTDGIELTGETPERGSAVFSTSGNIIYYRDENTADGYIRSIDLENANTIDPLSSVTGNLITAYNNNTYLTAGPDDNLYHWQEGEGVDFEVVSNSLTDILPQLSVKTGQSATGPVIQFVTRHLGDKYYELKDHPPVVGQALGNPDKSGQAIRATISDLRTMQAGLAQASMESYNNYYPFGMLMPGRWNSSENYRYGFNGKEMDNDFKSATGAIYDYGFRVYDSRIARFLSVDPLTASYPWYTPYQFAGNKPIWAIDLDGLEELEYTYTLKNGKVLTFATEEELEEYMQKNIRNIHKIQNGGSNGTKDFFKKVGSHVNVNRIVLTDVLKNAIAEDVKWETQYPDPYGCWDACIRILKKSGVRNPGDKKNNIQIALENDKHDELNPTSNFKKGVDEIDKTLNSGHGIVTGVNHTLGKKNKYGKPLNFDGTTDHYVVIYGREYDKKEGEIYYLFYEVGTERGQKYGASKKNRLYLNKKNSTLAGTNFWGKKYTVTQVRKNEY